ncbi:MAG: type II toxin-antitoxin system prevent-host-death family antitoxin [Verrucomicrobiae bacterium]|nr:type II toxin-antitoxin system prevent-host-death family antitoxin [Verrucomicrobiae bacterium]
MTKTADVKDVAAHFTEWLKEVAAGHEVLVTENDSPVARLVSPTTRVRDPAPRNVPRPPENLAGWIRANAHQGRPRSHLPVSQSELADEMFDRE